MGVWGGVGGWEEIVGVCCGFKEKDGDRFEGFWSLNWGCE